MTYHPRHDGLGLTLTAGIKIPGVGTAAANASTAPATAPIVGTAPVNGPAAPRLSANIKALVMPPTSPARLTLVPPECRKLRNHVPAPEQVPAGTAFVGAFPFTLASDAQVATMLQAILGTDGKGGGALVDAFIQMGTTFPRKISLVAAGWMRDPEAVQTITRGTFWVACAVDGAVSRVTAGRFIKGITERAATAAGLTVNSSKGSARIATAMLALDATSDLSDQALQAAAIGSAIGFAQIGVLVRQVFGGGTRITKDASLKTVVIEKKAATVQSALDILMGIGSIEQAVRNSCAAALAAPPDQAAAMQTALGQIKADLRSKRMTLLEGAQLATSVSADADVASTDVAMDLRREIVADAEAEIARGTPLGLMREYQRCAYLTLATNSLRSYITRVETSLTAAKQAALTLIAGAEQVVQGAALLDEMIKLVEYAESQLQLAWWERNLGPIPVWSWMAIGSTVFLGGVAVARSRKKARRAAEAKVKAPTPMVTKNRRRRMR